MKLVWIEIPTALTADEIAKRRGANTPCFRITNDLTQMTFRFSRDDAGKFLDVRCKNNPFAKLDQTGVGN